MRVADGGMSANQPVNQLAHLPANLPAELSIDTREMVLDTLLEESLRSRGFATNGWVRRMLDPLVTPPLNAFINMLAETDRRTETEGFSRAAGWLLTHFTSELEVIGEENIPDDGPILLLSNHPGAFDEIVIAATVRRPDLRIFANDHPVLTSFPAISRHAVYSGMRDVHQRMAGLRNGIRRLSEGDVLLLFPAGKTEPDPRYVEGASEAFANWSPSIELLLKKAPETRVIVTIVSNVVSSRVLHNPLMWFRRNNLERQKLAVSVQMVLQFRFPRLFHIVPRISFGVPMTLAQLTGNGQCTIKDAIIEQARALLPLHQPGAPGVRPLLLERA